MWIYVLLNLTRRLQGGFPVAKAWIACTMKPIWAWGSWVLFAYTIVQQRHAPNTQDSTLVAYSPPTLTGVGHQWMASTCTGCNQYLSLAKLALKVALVGRNRSVVTCTASVGRLLGMSSDAILRLWLLRHTEWGEATPIELQMNRLSLKNKRLTFKTSGKPF
jgi:hypothetical protein